MDYREVLDYLEGLGAKSVLGLDRVESSLTEIGRPQDSYKSIIVGGTNGKGSVSIYIASILQEAGYRVGLFTSPYIGDVREMIALNKEKIGEDDFASIGSEVIPAAERNNCTYFEVVTAIAMKYFEGKVDYAVLEVGMGGRLDATNIVDPEVSVITNVALDHSEVLGNTIEKQAFEKGGIIHQDGKLVTAEDNPKTLSILEKICRERKCEMKRVKEEDIQKKEFSLERQTFDACGYENLETRMLGSYQPLNAATAIEAVREAGGVKEVTGAVIGKGIRKAKLPGRFEMVQKEPLVILSAAHNPAGALRLAESIREVRKIREGGARGEEPGKGRLGEGEPGKGRLGEGEPGKGRLIQVLGFSKEKDIKSMIDILAKDADKAFFTKFRQYRSWDPSEYCKDFFEDPGEAVGRALEEANPGDIVCIAGSIYMLGEVRGRWLPEVEFE